MTEAIERYLRIIRLFKYGRWQVIAIHNDTGKIVKDVPPYPVRTYSKFGCDILAKQFNDANGPMSHVTYSSAKM